MYCLIGSLYPTKEKGIAGAVLPVRVGESPALTKKIKLVFIIYLSYLLFSFSYLIYTFKYYGDSRD